MSISGSGAAPAERIDASSYDDSLAAQVLQALPAAVYACDLEGRIIAFNEKAAELWGERPKLKDSSYRFCGAYKAYWPDGRHLPLDQSPIVNVLRTGEPITNGEVIIERRDGSRIVALVNVVALRDHTGRQIGAVNTFQDITVRRRIEDATRESERRLRDILEALPGAIYMTDAEGRLTFYNEAAVTLSGRRPRLGEDKWCVTWKLYWPDGRPLAHEDCPMAMALKQDRPIRGYEAVAERPDGTRVPFIPYPTPLHDDEGRLIGAINLLVDVSERKESETRQALLINELNHRVRNTLATVQGMAFQSFRDMRPQHAYTTFVARLLSLSRVHELLVAEEWKAAAIETIVQDVLAPHLRRSDDRVRLDGEAIRVPPRVALPLSMILHELTTNAVKYGALSSPEGKISVAWSTAEAADSTILKVEWRESGGPTVVPPARRGFGLQLIEQAVSIELKGVQDLKFSADGLICSFEFPLPTVEE